MFRKVMILTCGLLASSAAFADHGRHEGYHHHHHGHHHGHHYYPAYRERIVYAPPVVQYVPAPPVYYAPPAPRYYGYDQRSAQGLLGGMVGSAVGYEMGRGDPLAAGLGAAAGAWIGNGSRY